MVKRKPPVAISSADALRRRAERRAEATAAGFDCLTTDQSQSLFHELHVHQIELEIQNEELRAAGVELAHAHDKYLHLYDFAPVGYLTLDDTCTIREANLTVAGMLGVDRGRLIGKRLERFVIRACRDTLYLEFKKIVASQSKASLTLTFGRAGNAGFVGRVEIVPMADGPPASAVYRCALSDITPLHEAQEALARSEERFRALVTASSEVIYRASADWTEVRRLVGREFVADADASARSWLQTYVHPDDQPRVMAAITRSLRAKSVLESEQRVRRPDGSAGWIFSRAVPLLDAKGRVREWFGTASDITDRKRAEHELQLLNRNLEQQIVERTEAIQLLHDIATMANQAQSTTQAMEYCLRRMALYNGWCFGHALLPAADDPDELVPTYTWYAENPQRFAAFRETTFRLRLRRGQGLPGRVLASGQMEWSTDLSRDLAPDRAAVAVALGLRAAVAFPVRLGQRVVAVLEFFADRVIQPDQQVTDAMTGVGLQLGRVIERAEFDAHLLTIGDDIQRQIAQELHDDIGQELTGLGLKAETLVEMLGPVATPVARLAADIAASLGRTHDKIRGLSHAALPAELEQGLLGEALEQLAAMTSDIAHLKCEFTCALPRPILDSRVYVHLYRIAQEAVNNAVRHSAARTVVISLDQHDGGLILRIDDDGRGLVGDAAQREGMGRRTMRYRAELIGGKLAVGPGPRGGTQVECRIDLAAR